MLSSRRIQRHGNQSISLVANQRLDSFLGVIQKQMPAPGQANSLLVHPQCFFQTQITGFELGNDLTETLQNMVKAESFGPISLVVYHRQMVGSDLLERQL